MSDGRFSTKATIGVIGLTSLAGIIANMDDKKLGLICMTIVICIGITAQLVKEIIKKS